VLSVAVETLRQSFYQGLKQVWLVAYSAEEARVLKAIAARYSSPPALHPEAHPEGCLEKKSQGAFVKLQPQPPTLASQQPRLTVLGSINAFPPTREFPNPPQLILARGSVIDFVGDAMVNAANNGCVTGGALDAAVNQSGGRLLLKAREKLGGCETGRAKTIDAFGHKNTHTIIHTVRRSMLKLCRPIRSLFVSLVAGWPSLPRHTGPARHHRRV
jgi:hypothetical protein